MNLALDSDLSRSTKLVSDSPKFTGPMAIFVFSVCYIFLSDTHSQYEHTEGSLTDKCNMLGHWETSRALELGRSETADRALE